VRSVERTRASLITFLTVVYTWRFDHFLGHGPIGLHFSLPACRIPSLDEIGFFSEPNKKICVYSSALYNIPLVIFDGVLRPRSCYRLISDRFVGHESEEITRILEENRITPVVVEDGACNEFFF